MWEARSVAATLGSSRLSLEPVAARSAPPTLNQFLCIISSVSFPHRVAGGEVPPPPDLTPLNVRLRIRRFPSQSRITSYHIRAQTQQALLPELHWTQVLHHGGSTGTPPRASSRVGHQRQFHRTPQLPQLLEPREWSLPLPPDQVASPPYPLATVATSTRPEPAALSARAHSFTVAPVVITSSTSRK